MKDLLLWVILPLVLAEAVLIGPWLAERLLRWGARGLPAEFQMRYVEDWLGELDAVPGSLTKLAFAIRVVISVPATERVLTGRDALWIEVSRRFLAAAIAILLALLRLLSAQRRTSTRINGARDPAREHVNLDTRHARWDAPLAELAFTRPTAQSLLRHGISTYGQIHELYADHGEAGFFRIRNFGRQNMNEVTQMLAVLRPDPSDLQERAAGEH
jgi:hypothetical protein